MGNLPSLERSHKKSIALYSRYDDTIMYISAQMRALEFSVILLVTSEKDATKHKTRQQCNLNVICIDLG
jgi:hypothetical protein